MFSSIAMTGLSETTKIAESIGHKLNETVIEPGTRAVRDPEFSSNASNSLKNVGSLFSSLTVSV